MTQSKVSVAGAIIVIIGLIFLMAIALGKITQATAPLVLSIQIAQDAEGGLGEMRMRRIMVAMVIAAIQSMLMAIVTKYMLGNFARTVAIPAMNVALLIIVTMAPHAIICAREIANSATVGITCQFAKNAVIRMTSYPPSRCGGANIVTN